MSDNTKRINQLAAHLESLLIRQAKFWNEIHQLRQEITELKNEGEEASVIQDQVVLEEPSVLSAPPQTLRETSPSQCSPVSKIESTPGSPKIKSDLEKFIGENLINKIGIIILIIGVAIGAKYSIEHKLISPLTRIIIGYVIGAALLVFGLKLKKKYESYSAVLVSGAMAIIYFLTYAAYSFYGFIPQLMAFVIMVAFTVFTVMAAINYNRQVIGHIGMVGAYAVPFLLSDGSGNVAILFSYMTIINIGILTIAFKKYWKALYYFSFLLTWLIFSSWLFTKFSVDQHFATALLFLTVFFFQFYSIFLAYKLVKHEQFNKSDIALLLSNTFIFFGLGYYILGQHETGKNFLGLFSILNAILHSIVALIIFRKKLADRNLFLLVAGLVLVFITLAIPIQLDGNWVTLLWVFEAVLLFYIGRAKKVSLYEELSYPLMIISFISLLQDWWAYYPMDLSYDLVAPFTPILNIHFLTSMIFAGCFAIINYLNYITNVPDRARYKVIYGAMSYIMPAILIAVLYSSFKLEISNYFDRLSLSAPQDAWEDIKAYKETWINNYSFLFFSILAFFNIYKLRNRQLGFINLIINLVLIISFITLGMMFLAQLRDSFLSRSPSSRIYFGNINLWIRYISYAFVALIIIATKRYTRQEFMQTKFMNLQVWYEILLALTLLVIYSQELITWMAMRHYTEGDKLWLSILWGLYSLTMIAVGIWKNKKHLRIFAILLFGVTLIKLFFYDLIYLSTISKTIVFVSLGILLLIISFLYNKYRNVIGGK